MIQRQRGRPDNSERSAADRIRISVQVEIRKNGRPGRAHRRASDLEAVPTHQSDAGSILRIKDAVPVHVGPRINEGRHVKSPIAVRIRKHQSRLTVRSR